MRWFSSLRNRMVFFFVVMAVFPVTAVVGLTLWMLRGDVARETDLKNQAVASSLAIQVSQFLELHERVLKHAGRHAVEMHHLSTARLPSNLASTAHSHPAFASIYLLDPQGIVVDCFPPSPPRQGEDLSGLAPVKKAREEGRTVSATDPILPASSGPNLCLVVPLDEGWIIIGLIPCSTLLFQVQDVTVGSDGAVIVCDEQGIALMHSANQRLAADRTDLSALPPVAMAANRETGVCRYEHDGKQWMAAVTAIPRTGWSLAVVQSTATFDNRFWYWMGSLLAVLVIGTGLALLQGFIGTRSILRRIERMIHSFHGIAAGSLADCRRPDTFREFIPLTDKLTAMARAIKEREDTIVKAKEAWERTFDAVPDVIFLIDKDYRIMQCNRSTLEKFGLPADKIIGRTCFSLMHTAELPPAQCPHRKTLERQQAATVELFHPCLRGFFQVTTTPLLNDAGELLGSVHIAHDITELRQALEAVRLNESRLEALLRLNQMSDAPLDEITAFALDQAVRFTKSKIGYLAFVDEDESILSMHSWSKDTLHEGTVADQPPCCPVEATGLLGEAIRQRRAVITNHYDAPNPLKMGIPPGHARLVRHMNVPIFDGERIVAVAGVGNKEDPYCEADINHLDLLMDSMWRLLQRRQARQETARLATAVQQMGEAIVITDTRGRIQFVNPAFERMSGYENREVVGQSIRVLRTNDHDETFYRTLVDALRRGQTWSGQITERQKDGKFYQAEATICPVRDPSGTIINYVTIERDVTRELMLQKQLRQAQKMEALGTLAGGIAHDFNNILAAILGYTELAIDEAPAGSRLGVHLQQVFTAASRARDLVRQILAFSRQSEQAMQPLPIAIIVKEALKLLRASLPSSIEIRQQIAPALGAVLADPTQIHQVLMNLCTNAAHAMREHGGVLEVRLDEVVMGADELYRYPGLEAGTYVRLTVSDTGHGMPSDVVERIFDPFFTTKKPGEGTGLGLSAVYGIVKNHGGAISVYSEPGRGTSFHVCFPRLEAGEPQPQEIQPISALPGGKEHILLVDDEAALAGMGKQMLERLGYRVTAKTAAAEALEAFRADPHGYDLVLTDQTMPQMTGIELAQEIFSLRPETPVILCTGFSELIYPEKAQSMGIRALLSKPFILSNLAETVRTAMAVR